MKTGVIKLPEKKKKNCALKGREGVWLGGLGGGKKNRVTNLKFNITVRCRGTND